MVKNKGFTLLELVVVILIVGVLATLGFTQYGRMVERARGAEARQNIGYMRKLAAAYRLQNGSVTNIGYSDVNVGSSQDQLPNPCRSSHYFYYCVYGGAVDPNITLFAYRCSSGGKEPQNTTPGPPRLLLFINFSTGVENWGGTGDY